MLKKTKFEKDNMANFCTNCGTKIRKDDNFCTNCRTKIRKDDNFCTNCGTKIDKSDMQNNYSLKSASANIEKAIQEEEQIRILKQKEIISEKIEENEMNYGDYCDLNCIHCYEEFLDSDGEISGDYSGGGEVEYYCNLGHSMSYGSFCKDYR